MLKRTIAANARRIILDVPPVVHDQSSAIRRVAASTTSHSSFPPMTEITQEGFENTQQKSEITQLQPKFPGQSGENFELVIRNLRHSPSKFSILRFTIFA